MQNSYTDFTNHNKQAWIENARAKNMGYLNLHVQNNYYRLHKWREQMSVCYHATAITDVCLSFEWHHIKSAQNGKFLYENLDE